MPAQAYMDLKTGSVCVKWWYEREIALHLLLIVVRRPLLPLLSALPVGTAFWPRDEVVRQVIM